MQWFSLLNVIICAHLAPKWKCLSFHVMADCLRRISTESAWDFEYHVVHRQFVLHLQVHCKSTSNKLQKAQYFITLLCFDVVFNFHVIWNTWQVLLHLSFLAMFQTNIDKRRITNRGFFWFGKTIEFFPMVLFSECFNAQIPITVKILSFYVKKIRLCW